MRTVMGAMTLVGAVLCLVGVAAALTGAIPSVVSSGTVPGNGDMNADGTVNAIDAQLVLKFVTYGSPVQSVKGYQQGDTNFNGRIDSADATLIQQKIAGLVRLPTRGFSRGSVNGDGIVNAVDATLIWQYVDGAPIGTRMYYNMDANQDYSIDMRDVECTNRIAIRLPCN